MKLTCTTLLRLAATALSVVSLAITSAAASQPLSSPQGLAVAANGTLYVANNTGNNVLAYNPAHKQVAALTITSGISSPTSVAFDPSGNLWVANAGSDAITEYDSKGVQNTKHTITAGISAPYVIAFDGLADLWVNNSYSNLSVYPQSSSTPNLSIPTGSTSITSIALWQGFFVLGENNGSLLFQTSTFLEGKGSGGNAGFFSETCFAAAFDKSGNLYCANEDHSLVKYAADGSFANLVPDMGFFPFGLALDQTRGYLYVSDGIGNSIAVYNLSGTLLKTIK